MSEKDFLVLLDELFEEEPGTTKASDSLVDHPAWNSLTFVGLIALVDDECGVTLVPEGVRRCQSIADLLDLLGDAVVRERQAA